MIKNHEFVRVLRIQVFYNILQVSSFVRKIM